MTRKSEIGAPCGAWQTQAPGAIVALLVIGTEGELGRGRHIGLDDAIEKRLSRIGHIVEELAVVVRDNSPPA